jgi:hypothetical protein
MSKAPSICGWNCRNASRSNLRVLERVTDPPTLLLTTTPRREYGRSVDGRQFMIIVRENSRSPVDLSEANSQENCIRCGSRNRKPCPDAAIGSDYTGVNLLRPFLRRPAKIARPLLLEFRLKNPCWRLRRIFDG